MLKLLLCKLKDYLPDYADHVLCNSLILTTAIIKTQTVCLNKMKGHLGSITGNITTSSSSNYKRLTRYFQANSTSLLWLDLVKLGLRLLRLQIDYLVLDGTTWERGSRKHHYQTLCIVYKGIAIPIIWLDLEKKGASGYEERKQLFDLAFEYFDLKGKTLLADREYIGKKWFRYLINNGLNFVIRSKDYTYFDQIDKSGKRTIEQMIAKVLRSKVPNKAIAQTCKIGDCELRVIVGKNPDPEAKEAFIILLTTLENSAYQIVQMYLIRWKIEHCFKQLKSNGFDLETINLGTVERRRLMFGLVVLAYIISVVEGLVQYHKVKLKKYANSSIYKAESVFRYGYDLVNLTITNALDLNRLLIRKIRAANSKYSSIRLLHVQ